MKTLIPLLLELEEKLLNPEIRKSVKEIDELLADEFIEFGSTGKIYNKQQVIESLTNELPAERNIFDFNVVLLSVDTALAMYKVISKNPQTNEIKDSLRSSIWKKYDGSWKMLFHQGTIIKND